MKKMKHLLLAFVAVLATACSQSAPEKQVSDLGTAWSWDKGTIVVETPERLLGRRV